MHWKQLLEHSIKLASTPSSNYVQLATVNRKGAPSVRTIVFRGFLPSTPDTTVLTFVTDSRSGKIQDLIMNPAVELCWYFESSREQYRLSGEMCIVSSIEEINTARKRTVYKEHSAEQLEQERLRVWSEMSDFGRGGFAGPFPGKPLEQHDQISLKAFPKESELIQQHHQALDRFCLLLLIVNSVDYLHLKRPQKRILFARNSVNEWECNNLNP